MTIIKTLQSIIDCGDRNAKLAQSNKKVDETAIKSASEILKTLSMKLSKCAYQLLQKDWCPEEYRHGKRDKFKYHADDVGVLVLAYLQHSSEPTPFIDTMTPPEVKKADLSKVSRRDARYSSRAASGSMVIYTKLSCRYKYAPNGTETRAHYSCQYLLFFAFVN
jgi:hypothetical protein